MLHRIDVVHGGDCQAGASNKDCHGLLATGSISTLPAVFMIHDLSESHLTETAQFRLTSNKPCMTPVQ